MNGSEIVTKSAFGESLELTQSEKMDIIAGDGGPYANAIKKLMKLEITRARDEAMECDPTDKEKQHVLMTIAHAMEKFHKNLMGSISFEKTSHLIDVKDKVLQEVLKDREKYEEIVFHNQTH